MFPGCCCDYLSSSGPRTCSLSLSCVFPGNRVDPAIRSFSTYSSLIGKIMHVNQYMVMGIGRLYWSVFDIKINYLLTLKTHLLIVHCFASTFLFHINNLNWNPNPSFGFFNICLIPVLVYIGIIYLSGNILVLQHSKLISIGFKPKLLTIFVIAFDLLINLKMEPSILCLVL